MKYYKPKANQAKVLLLDIETAPLLVHVWGIFEQNVGLEQIKKDFSVLSWSAKWAGSPAEEIMYQDNRNKRNLEDDKNLLKGIWRLLDEADIVVGHNADAFDTKRLNARFIEHGMQPPSSYKIIDTLKIARSRFNFTSNKLATLTAKLCPKHKKSEHKNYPGFSLWKACLAGDQKAWKEMELYNKQDVLSLEKLYEKLLPWMKGGPNFNLYHNGTETICRCGSNNWIKKGISATTAGIFQRYRCKDCGSECRDRKSKLSKSKKEFLKANVS